MSFPSRLLTEQSVQTETNLKSVIEALAALQQVDASQEVGLVLLRDVIGRALTVRSVPEVLEEVEVGDGLVEIAGTGRPGQSFFRQPSVKQPILQLGQLGCIDAELLGSGASHRQPCERKNISQLFSAQRKTYS